MSDIEPAATSAALGTELLVIRREAQALSTCLDHLSRRLDRMTGVLLRLQMNLSTHSEKPLSDEAELRRLVADARTALDDTKGQLTVLLARPDEAERLADEFTRQSRRWRPV